MPEVSRFFGIIIRMYFNEHNPPHFHAVYGEQEALIEIETLAVLRGSLPRRALAMAINGAHFIGKSCVPTGSGLAVGIPCRLLIR